MYELLPTVERVLSIAVLDIKPVGFVDIVANAETGTELLLGTIARVTDETTLDRSVAEAKATWHPLLPLSQAQMVPGAIGCHMTLPKLQRP